jgi:hypothetical protein
MARSSPRCCVRQVRPGAALRPEARMKHSKQPRQLHARLPMLGTSQPKLTQCC